MGERRLRSVAIGSGGTTRRSCSARLARLATHAVLDPADRAPMHPTGSGKVTTPLSSGQGSPDFTNLFVRQLGERVLFPSYTSPVPQTVGRVALWIAQVKIARPVVSPIIIAMADELVAAELPAQDYHHYRTMQHDPAFSRPSV